MLFKKSALIVPLSLCLIYTSSVTAEPSFTQKYAPYLGYEGGYSNYRLIENKSKKYTPRFFAGFTAIQKPDYKIGLEFGYTLPASFEENRYNYYDKFVDYLSLDVKKSDLYLTFRQNFSHNFYWFLNPGLEYAQRDYKASGKYFSMEGNTDSVFLSSRAGIGYNLNRGLGTNLFIKYRIHDFNHANITETKSLIKVNLQYTF